jgi:hypothetical protein
MLVSRTIKPGLRVFFPACNDSGTIASLVVTDRLMRRSIFDPVVLEKNSGVGVVARHGELV